jgi:DNA-binding CsgD family transcriptional regulator
VRLSHLDFDALQRTIVDLYAHRDTAAFRQAIPALCLKAIPGDYFGLIDLSVDMARNRIDLLDHWESRPRITADTCARMEQHGWHDHPFTKYAMEHGDPTALKFSDFYSLRQLRSQPMYNNFYRVDGVGRLLAVPSFTGPGMATLNFCRLERDRDFTERDRLMLNLLRPHFDQARRNAELATALQATEAHSLEEALDLTPREAEVARWLAFGKTNPEIALILQTRARTVEKHLESILRKVGVENRTAAAIVIAKVNGHGNGMPPGTR